VGAIGRYWRITVVILLRMQAAVAVRLVAGARLGLPLGLFHNNKRRTSFGYRPKRAAQQMAARMRADIELTALRAGR